MYIRDVLRHKGGFVATVPPEVTITDLLALLTEHNVGALVVSRDGVGVLGIVSERDVVRRVAADGTGSLDELVSDVMTSDVMTATPDDSVESVMRIMTENRIRHVPVVVEDQLVGIISIGDVVKNRMDELEGERESLIGYIHSGG